MYTEMEMSTGKVIQDEFGNFEYEVMNAEWLPPQAALQLGLQTVEHQADHAVAESDVDAFLHRLYNNL